MEELFAMKYGKIILFVSLFASNSVFSQNEVILFSVGKTPVTLQEFESYYRRASSGVSDTLSKEAYLNSFVDYKLKVEDAKIQKLDQSESFRKEYERYTKEIKDSGDDQSAFSEEIYEEMLSFEWMKDNVWNGQKIDEIDLKKFFNKNRNRYSKLFPKFKGCVVLCADEYSKNKTNELFHQYPESLSKAIVETQKIDSHYYVQIEEGIWQKGENDFVDYRIFDGDLVPATGNNYPLFVVCGNLISEPSLDAIRIEVINDYQQTIENVLLKKLKDKYPVKMNHIVANSLK